MYIRDIFYGYDCEIYGKNTDITTISIHSEMIGAKCLYFAHNGENFRGRDNVGGAMKNGAVAVCTDDREVIGMCGEDVTVIFVRNTRHAESFAAERLYPVGENMKIIGVTGTNGKTSVCHMGKKVFSALGRNCAYTGTLGTDIEGYEKALSNTTPPPSVYRKIIHDAASLGVEYVFSEVSSQGILQERTTHTPFHALIFTNLTHDHLDCHGDMESYFKAKSKVFWQNKCFYIINTDDPYGTRLYDDIGGVSVSVGEGEGCFVRISSFYQCRGGIAFKVTMGQSEINIYSPLYGMFNAYNIALICALAYMEGFSAWEIEYAVNSALKDPVPGRMERYSFGGRDIFVDYAHTPDALENALCSIREIYGGKIVTVFGCGGERDKTKRSEMGKIACEYSDHVILTEDNSRSEETEEIISMIYSGCDSSKTEIYPCRRQAITKGFSLLCRGDVLLIAGRGSEEYLTDKSGTVKFSDREFVKYLCRGED